MQQSHGAERVVALHNYKHVVDADSQQQEGQHAIHGPKGHAKEAAQPTPEKINS